MRRTITVLQDDIDNGKKQESTQCAIARAAYRDLADLTYGHEEAEIDVHYDTLVVSSLHSKMMECSIPDLPMVEVKEATTLGFADLPEKACRFIESFDEGEPVEPFKFEIDLGPIVPKKESM